MYKIADFDGITMIQRIDEIKNEARWFTTDPDNSDFQQYERWLDEGNTPEQWTAETDDE